ncbi:hypothetical protein M9H77_02276 [Catharanthus roseus]|uniref:Uncharacterized protein n=1 Tax=Catharanthus roseus TaxID=4058 RepID=A0ACC0C7X7_CATRO|nr:hypothetical protein M9H77_02276 [Catharanthus roseus]
MFKTSEVNARHYVSQSIGKKWAAHTLKLWNEVYDPTLSRDAIINNVPTSISSDQWTAFIDYRLRSETQPKDAGSGKDVSLVASSASVRRLLIGSVSGYGENA